MVANEVCQTTAFKLISEQLNVRKLCCVCTQEEFMWYL